MKIFKIISVISIVFILIITILIVYSRDNLHSEDKTNVLSNPKGSTTGILDKVLATPNHSQLSTISNINSTPNKSPYPSINTTNTMPDNSYFPIISNNISSSPNNHEYINTIKFEVFPVKIDGNNWLAKLAGSINKSINVCYGKMGTNNPSGEAYIIITVENSSDQYVANSYSRHEDYEVYEFYSAKTFNGSSVVKDFSGDTLQYVYFYIFNDGTKLLYPFTADKYETSNFWTSQIPTEGYYTSDFNMGN